MTTSRAVSRTVSRAEARLARPGVLPGLERRVLRTLIGLPAAWALRLAGGVPTRGDDGVLDPTVQLILTRQRRRGMLGVTAGTAEATRRRLRLQTAMAAGEPTPVDRVRHLRVPGADGLLAARHYVPPGGGRQAPLLVFPHGGGFV